MCSHDPIPVERRGEVSYDYIAELGFVSENSDKDTLYPSTNEGETGSTKHWKASLNFHHCLLPPASEFPFS